MRRILWLALLAFALPGPAAAVAQDEAPTLTIDNPSPHIEEDGGTGAITFTVTYEGQATGPVTAEYRTVPITATQGTSCSPGIDYLQQFGSVAFFADDADRTREISVAICGDTLDEPDETFRVELFNESANVEVENRRGDGMIIDDDPTPSILIDDVIVDEPDAGGTATATFDVRLSRASGQEVDFNFATEAATGATRATPGAGTCDGTEDFLTTGGERTIPRGSLRASSPVEVTICGDVRDETDEIFFVDVTPTNASGTPRGRGTIVDDDPPPDMSIDDVTVTEGDSGTSNATFTVELSAASGRPVRVDYATSDGTARGTGTGVTSCGTGHDYVTRSAPSFTIPADQPERTFTVPVCGDRPDEADETFNVTLSNAVGAVLTDATALATIVDNDPLPRLSITRAADQIEGNSGVVNRLLVFGLTDPRDGRLIATGRGVPLTLRTIDGTASDATRSATGGAACGPAGVDYQSMNGTPDGVPAGRRFGTVAVRICGDTTAERSELLSVLAENVQNATVVNGTSVVRIVNDDGPRLSIGDATALEGDLLQFTVTLTGATTEPVRAEFLPGNGTARADSLLGSSCTRRVFPPLPTGNDFARTSGAVAFPASPAATQTRTVTVQTCPDDRFEGSETMSISLRRPDFGRIDDGEGTGTILDEDECLPEAGCTGTATLTPEHATVPAKSRVAYDLTWTVPDGRVWRDLETIDLRLRDEDGTALWLRWDEASNGFCLIRENGDACRNAKQPGSRPVLSGKLAKVHLRDTTVTGSGPTGRSVVLGLSLSLRPGAAARTFAVEAAATDDLGRHDAFERVGTLTVERR